MKLSAYRKALGLTQAEFAKLVGCSQARISEIETGETPPSFALAARIEKETGGSVGFSDWLDGAAA